MVQGVDVLNELFNEEELKEISDNNQINQGKPAQVIYWERRKEIEQRLQEALKLGFKRAIVPASNLHGVETPEGIEVIGVKTLKQALKHAQSQT